MTVDARLAPCPECKAVDSVDLSDGVRLCLACRTEWRPGDVFDTDDIVTGDAGVGLDLATDIRRILDAPTPGDALAAGAVVVLDTLATVSQLPSPSIAPADWAGMFARFPSGGVVVVTRDDGDGYLDGVTASGVELQCLKDEAVYLGESVDAAGNPIDPNSALDAGPMVPAILAVAGLCLTVGLDAVSEDEGGALTNPRIGWLPPPCDEVPEAEQGCAYAVALLVRTFGLDHDAVRTLAANLLTGAEAGTETGDTE